MDTTFGRYRLLESLGKSRFAERFRAKSFGVEGFEAVLALDVVAPEWSSSRKFVESFVREAKLAVRLAHANVVQVHDVGRGGGEGGESWYLATELVEGLDLHRVLLRARASGVRLPPEGAAYVVAELAKGLEHAHRRRDDQLRPLGMVHGDVGPSAVMLSWEGAVKLGEFGLARAAAEGAGGTTTTVADDVAALGATLWEALAGQLLPPDARRVAGARVPSIERLRDDLSPELAALVARALGAADEARLPDAGALHEALLPHLYGHGGRFGAAELAAWLAPLRGVAGAEPARPSFVAHVSSSPVGEGDRPRFVGRRDELKQLGEWLALATRRKLQVVTLRGPAGIGKSRTLAEIERRLQKNDYDVAWRLSTCPPSGRVEPLSGLVAMLRALVTPDAAEPRDGALRRLRATGLAEAAVLAISAALDAGAVEPSRRRHLRDAFVQLVERLGAERLHVLAWDAAQALDDDSRRTLVELAERSPRTRAVLLLATSDPAPHALESLPVHHGLELGELDDRDTAHLVASVARARHAPPELVAVCRTRAGGNPRAVEELVRELEARGAVVVENGGFVYVALGSPTGT